MKFFLDKKREKFVTSAVESLHALAKFHGVGGISKETLAFIIQRYIGKYQPTSLPRAPKPKRKLEVVK